MEKIRFPGIFLGVVALLLSVGCGRWERKSEQPPRLLNELYSSDPTLPPASTNGIIIRGTMPAHELHAIAVVVGRIPNITHRIKEIMIVWEEAAVAARVYVDDYVVFLVKTRTRGWEVATVGLRSTDSWPESPPHR
jgi:hypothetical protein